MKRNLKLLLLAAALTVCTWAGRPDPANAAYKYCWQMRECSPNGAWTACWSANAELFRCFCVNGWWDCSQP